MKVKATLKNLRISPRKVRLVTNLIKGMEVENALVQLSHAIKGSSRDVAKLLKSAIANAENNFGLDMNNLFISDVQVGEGSTLKRWLPRAHGRATPLMKRTSNIFMVLEEKIEGIGRKSKVKKSKKIKKEDLTEKTESEETTELKNEKNALVVKKISAKKVSAKGSKGGFSKKVFQRKSV